MRRYLVVLAVLLGTAAMAVPAWAAVEFKYGGLYQLEFQSGDNVIDGTDELDDNYNFFQQRMRMYFSFVASERLQLVTMWEADTAWGYDSGGRHGGGDVGADAVSLEMKNVYIDFLIPRTRLRANVGIQGLALLKGWIIDDDFSAAVVSTDLEPFKFLVGYIAAQNEDVISTNDNIDDFFLSIDYTGGPFAASLLGFFQHANQQPAWLDVQPFNVPAPGLIEDNNLFDLGLSLGYTTDMFNVYLNAVKNFGSFDVIGGGSVDYSGWMLEAGSSLFVDNFTFTLGGFITSGDDDPTDDDMGFFAYPAGRSHYWSEILGIGTLENNSDPPPFAGTTFVVGTNEGYAAGDGPTNLWTLSLGTAWQALPTTKLTLNYYYIGTVEDVVSAVGVDAAGNLVVTDTDDAIGHEIDFYVDQEVMDGLILRLVGAYLFAEDGYTIFPDDDDAYEVGAQLLWAF